MALPILDGNQSATTLSTILSSGQHITAHTVVSLGTQAITDISGAVSGSVISISNLPATQPVSISSVTIGNTVTISGTVTANPTGTQTIAGTVTVGNTVTVSGTVNAGLASENDFVVIGEEIALGINNQGTIPISGTVTANLGSALPSGTNRIGVVTIGAGTVTIGAGTAQIGSVTASISGTVPVSISSVTVGNSVTISSLPSLVAGTAQIGVVTIGNIRRAGDNAISQLSTEAGSNYLLTVVMPGTSQIGSVTASISNSVTIASLPAISGTVTANVPFFNFGEGVSDGGGNLPIYGIQIGYADSISGEFQLVADNKPLPISGTVTANTFALQGTAVTTSNFTSTTPSTVLASANSGREVLTIFNEGAGNLHICAGATCTTIAYQVRLSAGDYYEVPNHQTTITHSAVFATAGTARVTEVS